MIFVIDKSNLSVKGCFPDLSTAKAIVKNINECYVTEEANMRIIPRVVTVDGNYVYCSKKFWMKEANDIFENYDAHEVKDILGQPVSKIRYSDETTEMINRIIRIDGRPGQIEYNMQVGKEFVSLFREECILTKFTKESDTSPMKIFEKLTPVIAMLDAGAFREAKQYLAGYRQMLKDDFLTDERIDKYIAMLDAADAIEYATEEDYFYTAPEVVNDSAV